MDEVPLYMKMAAVLALTAVSTLEATQGQIDGSICGRLI